MKAGASSTRAYNTGQVSAAKPAPSLFDCQTTFQKIAKKCVYLIQSNRKLAIAGDPRAIHKMRMELTKLRAIVLFFYPMKDVAWPRIRKELRWLNSALGKARDHNVTMNYTERKRYRSWARSTRRSLLRAQDKGHRSLAKKLSSARYTRLIVTLSHWITNGSWLVNSGPFRSERIDVYSQARLRDWRSRIWREGRHIRALRRKQLHRLRIQAKHYRYVVDALQTLAIKNTRQDLVFYETAKQVHRALGDLRDLKRLRRAANDRPPGYRKRKRKLLQQAEKPFRRPVCGGET